MAEFEVCCVVGTRPEGIKMAPVVLELRRYAPQVRTTLVSTGQHQEMLAQALAPFDLAPDVDLGIMQHGQTLSQVMSRSLEGLDHYLANNPANAVLGQGDTTTCLAASLAAFYRGVDFGHIEAGLRTADIHSPFPEEFNRRMVAVSARWHFSPTPDAAENLIAEGRDPASIELTGNTGIDAVRLIANRSEAPDGDQKLILLTTHRRENWGEPQREISKAVRRLLEEHRDYRLMVPMHRNPAVREVLNEELGGHPQVSLIEPPEYQDFVQLMRRCRLILTDSGGVQEEAPAFGIPVLVLRETTERPEGVRSGVAKLVGTDAALIYEAANELLSSEVAWAAMARASSPYGDGLASERIRHRLLKDFGMASPAVPKLLKGHV